MFSWWCGTKFNANNKVKKLNIFKNIWVQPASGDAGGSLGSALAINYLYLNKNRKIDKKDSMKGAYLGPEWSKEDIKKKLK